MQTVTLSARRVGVTSDTHYNHRNIIKYCLRPHLSDDERRDLLAGRAVDVSNETLERHNAALVDGINAALGAADVLIHAGDVAWKGGVAELGEFRDRLKVREIHVVVGNHDDASDLTAVFGADRVHERICLSVGGQEAVVDHYPGDRWHNSHRGSWLLFGHTHGAINRQRRAFPGWALSADVGVDSHEFRPWLWDELSILFAPRWPAWKAWKDKEYPGKDAGGMAPDGPV